MADVTSRENGARARAKGGPGQVGTMGAQADGAGAHGAGAQWSWAHGAGAHEAGAKGLGP